MITAPMTAYTPVTYSPMMPATNQQQGAIQQHAQVPGYIYNYPTASSYASPAKSQFNGVNIEIINPVGSTGNPNGTLAPASTPAPVPAQYCYPYPVMMPASAPVSQATVQAPPAAPVVAPAPQITTPAPVAQTPVAPAPVAQTPVAPAQVAQTPVAQTPVAQTPVAQTPVAPAPQVATPAAPVAPTVDVAAFAGKLQTTDLNAQQAAIEEIAELVKNDKTIAPELLDTRVFDALVGIVNTDTSTLQGPTPEIAALRNKPADQLTEAEKQQAKTITPLDQAEMNKQYALYTIAFMQNRLNSELEQRGGQNLELKDLPCIDTVINAVKSNPNPNIRQGAIAALSHIAKPQYKADLQTIFDLAKADEDANVQAAATRAISELK